METQVFDFGNGYKQISVFGETAMGSSTGMVSNRRVSASQEAPEERINRVSEGSISLDKRIARLEGQGNATESESMVQETSMPFDERAEDIMVDRIIGLSSSDPVTKRRTLEKIEAEGMTKEEARESLEEDALVDNILAISGQKKAR